MARHKHEELGGMLLEKLQMCADYNMSVTAAIVHILDAGEEVIAGRYGAGLARRSRFIHGALLLRGTCALAAAR